MAEVGVRERKKLATRRAIVRATRDVVREVGLDGASVAVIASAAGVSERTFFNYFSCKEEAMVAIDPVTLADIGAALRDRPSSENAVQALRAVLIDRSDPEGQMQRWQLRSEVVAQYPGLRPQHLAAMGEVESELVAALAERLDTDPATDPLVRLTVAAVLSATRTANAWWHESDRARPLLEVLDDAIARVERGFSAS